jgi:hypothetical protein
MWKRLDIDPAPTQRFFQELAIRFGHSVERTALDKVTRRFDEEVLVPPEQKLID